MPRTIPSRSPSLRASAPAAPRLGALIPGVLARLGRAETLERWRAVVEWEQIVGESLARNARAVRVDGDVLIVEAEHPTMIYQLSYQKAELLDRLRAHLGAARIRDVRLVLTRSEQR